MLCAPALGVGSSSTRQQRAPEVRDRRERRGSDGDRHQRSSAKHRSGLSGPEGPRSRVLMDATSGRLRHNSTTPILPGT
ncbi:hypothetical protein NDU88_003722 [Pleurodeles waltl]|uniref:Uncharacterized protein n=1 Tax=Pleurodeles waltl TaxID=8319 RepID=A0AAV7MRE9_PLEWA|nr:hypothetical protein NDU88_003722 [Pleurodeles waltl]